MDNGNRWEMQIKGAGPTPWRRWINSADRTKAVHASVVAYSYHSVPPEVAMAARSCAHPSGSSSRARPCMPCACPPPALYLLRSPPRNTPRGPGHSISTQKWQHAGTCPSPSISHNIAEQCVGPFPSRPLPAGSMGQFFSCFALPFSLIVIAPVLAPAL
jgi:hypothetical protein